MTWRPETFWMPFPTRRTVLTAVGSVTVGGLSGCASLLDGSLPAGSLRFVNDHTLPHSIRIEVTGVGTDPGEDPGEVVGDVIAPPTQRSLTASTTVGPMESETYEDVFTEPVYYGIQFLRDGEIPENNAGAIAFNPSDSDGGAWEILVGKVYESGEFSWVVSSTDNPGSFAQ